MGPEQARKRACVCGRARAHTLTHTQVPGHGGAAADAGAALPRPPQARACGVCACVRVRAGVCARALAAHVNNTRRVRRAAARVPPREEMERWCEFGSMARVR